MFHKGFGFSPQEVRMFDAYGIARAITEETQHPIWGELFKHVVAGELNREDVELAIGIERPCPDWVKAVAGGNLALLHAVAEVAFDDFIATWLMHNAEADEMSDALSERLCSARSLSAFTGSN